ncbi:MAG: hypothetical protein A2046_00570, partial [Bacteroidetes bacterium GWA2_30_7]
FSQDFEVAPVDIKFNANPGEIQTNKVTIRNHGNKKQQFSVILSDYEVKENGSKVPVKEGESKHSLANWLNVNPSFFELNPNESKELEVILTVPHDGNGTRWGKLLIQPAVEQSAIDADKSLSTGVIIVPRIVVWVTQTPKNSSNYNASIKDLVDISESNDSLRKFSATIINSGDNIIKAKVFLAVADLSTAVEKKYPPIEENVYPGSTKNVTLRIPVKLSKGRYVIAAILDYGHRKPLEGTQIMIEQK